MKDYALVLAADLPTPKEVLSMVKVVGPVLDGIKVAVSTMLESTMDMLGRIRDEIGSKPLLVDLKVADIGFSSQAGWQGTNAKIIGKLANSGATHVTVHGFPGPVSVAEAVGAGQEAGIGVLLLPLMSHAGARLFFSRPMERTDLVYACEKAGLKLKFPDLPCSDVTEGILLLGEALNVDGYIGPATRPHDLQRYRSITQRPLWCPGFGRQDRQGRGVEEQFRQWAEIVGPSSAAIVGSAVFKAADPLAAAEELVRIRDAAVEHATAKGMENRSEPHSQTRQ